MTKSIETITVQKGDTLSKIANQYNKSINEIMELNKDIKNQNMIYEGQQIKLSKEIETVDLGLPQAELKSPIGVRTVSDRDMSYSAQAKAMNEAANKSHYTTHEQVIAKETKGNLFNQEIDNVDLTPKFKPENFNFKHESSNILAAKAKNMGFNDEQILIAVGISRYETGNYQHLAGGFNYGGVTGSGDAGKTGKYAKYSSQDVGMDAYLNNLKENYFDVGLNSVDSMARKYLGYDNTSHWISQVKGCMEKNGIYKA